MSEEPSGEDPPPSYDEVMRENMIDDQDLMTETVSAPPENEVVVIPEENVGNGNDETQQNVSAIEKMRNCMKFFLNFIGWCFFFLMLAFLILIVIMIVEMIRKEYNLYI